LRGRLHDSCNDPRDATRHATKSHEKTVGLCLAEWAGMNVKAIIAVVFAAATIIAVAAPTARAAAPVPAPTEQIGERCIPRGWACPRKDEGFVGACCDNNTCRGGVCGG
jgi:hypothetical protein